MEGEHNKALLSLVVIAGCDLSYIVLTVSDVDRRGYVSNAEGRYDDKDSHNIMQVEGGTIGRKFDVRISSLSAQILLLLHCTKYVL